MTVRDLYMTATDLNAHIKVTAYDKIGTRIHDVECWGDLESYYGEKEVLQFSFETKTLTLGVYHERIN